MHRAYLADIKEKISVQHEGDERQLQVIFSDSLRLIVEAPAGYGKTTTMISRIAYLFASGEISNPKRILGLTFSVNAALKIKREVDEKLPALLNAKSSPIALGDKVTVTNYHGFCKGILKKYGYLMSDTFRKDINLFRAVGNLIDSQGNITTEWKNIANSLSLKEQKQIIEVDYEIGNGILPTIGNIQEYSNIITRKLLPVGYITHNAIILYVIQIFDSNTEIKKFYQNYYPLIVVDEFQDTNCIAWSLLEAIISEQTKLIFLGDPLQRIYGFIGALPNVMMTATEKYGMTHVSLSKNYRFRNNSEMLKLDKNIRANAACYFATKISDDDNAILPVFWGSTQKAEAQQVVAKVQTLISNPAEKIAILFRSRSKNADIVEAELLDKQVPYFYGMFTDEDTDYVDFHNKCQDMFTKRFGKSKAINNKALKAFSESVKTAYLSENGKTIESLLRLLDALVEKVTIDYADIQSEDKYNLLLDIFENRQLKQAMEYVDSQVIISTVHGAKGLEWDYVIVSDVEQWVFTFQCRECPSNFVSHGTKCQLPGNIPDQIKNMLLDDLCVFYVALTRAKKQVFISASAERFNSQGRKFTNGKICCFALVNGIKLENAGS